MQFILSLLMTISFGLTLLQCGNAQIGSNQTIQNAVNSSAKTNSAAETTAQADEAPRITLAEAKSDFDAGSAIFVDARPADSYKVEHIKNSINVPLGEVETKYKDIPTNKKIIVYCS